MILRQSSGVRRLGQLALVSLTFGLMQGQAVMGQNQAPPLRGPISDEEAAQIEKDGGMETGGQSQPSADDPAPIHDQPEPYPSGFQPGQPAQPAQARQLGQLGQQIQRIQQSQQIQQGQPVQSGQPLAKATKSHNHGAKVQHRQAQGQEHFFIEEEQPQQAQAPSQPAQGQPPQLQLQPGQVRSRVAETQPQAPPDQWSQPGSQSGPVRSLSAESLQTAQAQPQQTPQPQQAPPPQQPQPRTFTNAQAVQATDGRYVAPSGTIDGSSVKQFLNSGPQLDATQMEEASIPADNLMQMPAYVNNGADARAQAAAQAAAQGQGQALAQQGNPHKQKQQKPKKPHPFLHALTTPVTSTLNFMGFPVGLNQDVGIDASLSSDLPESVRKRDGAYNPNVSPATEASTNKWFGQ